MIKKSDEALTQSSWQWHYKSNVSSFYSAELKEIVIPFDEFLNLYKFLMSVKLKLHTLNYSEYIVRRAEYHD